jgi:hypothetical protein
MLAYFLKPALAALCCWLASHGQPVGVAVLLPEQAETMIPALGDDPVPAVPLCHKVTPVTLLNCANSSSLCVTAVTPNYVCNLVIRDGNTVCRCVP